MDLPNGAYKKVHVVDIIGGTTLLSEGTGTMLNCKFSCGPFEEGFYPNKKNYFNITLYNEAGQRCEENRVECFNSGKTSDFE